MSSNVTAGTIARTFLLVLALINQVLTVLGVSPIPIEDETVTLIVSTLWTTIAALVAWWKNNSYTAAAVEGDKLMRELKEE